MKTYFPILSIILLVITMFTASAQDTTDETIQFAVIGDFGREGDNLQAVSDMIHKWDPDFIITTGDNNYPDGEEDTIDENIGQYFHDFIYPYVGDYGEGADTNRFFPTLGNHDLTTDDGQPYFDYFELPGNERYYDFVWGPVHFFTINSDSREPDGNRIDSVQAEWLQENLTASSSPWQVVYFHQAPYSSGMAHGSKDKLQWPFKDWGADVVFSGHDHVYERLEIDGLVYFVNGIGGSSKRDFDTPIEGSLARYNEMYGAQLVTATECELTFEFYSVEEEGTLIDSYTLNQCE